MLWGQRSKHADLISLNGSPLLPNVKNVYEEENSLKINVVAVFFPSVRYGLYQTVLSKILLFANCIAMSHAYPEIAVI